MNTPKVAAVQLTVVELREIAEYCARVRRREPYCYVGVTRQRIAAGLEDKVHAALAARHVAPSPSDSRTNNE